MRRILSIGEALAALGIVGDLPLTGYVVSARWADGKSNGARRVH